MVVLALSASCAAPEPPDEWAVNRVTPTDEIEAPTDGICADVRALALGSHADETTLDGTLEELARIAAVTGATAALPLITEFTELADDQTISDERRAIEQHDLLVSASRVIDDATSEACELPAFSALYATTGFPDCHFEMEIPIAAYTEPGTTGECSVEGRPDFLPCWSKDGNHLAIDCVTDEIVTVAGDRWAAAGPPRVVKIDRPDHDETPGPALVRAIPSTECHDLAAIFRSAPLPNGASPDFAALDRGAAGLDADVGAQIDQFVEAMVDPPSFDEFEALVSALDEATAAACGFPVVSAWTSITTPLVALPCWSPTGVPYPAYETADCTN